MVGIRSTATPEPDRFGPVWTAIGVVVMSLEAIAVFRLDDGITRIVGGAALAMCLAMVAAMVWLRRRDTNSIEPDRRD